MHPVEHIIIQELIDDGPCAPRKLEGNFRGDYRKKARETIARLTDEGALRLNDDLKLEFVGELGEPGEGEAVCEECDFCETPDNFLPAFDVYHAIRCPVCGTTDIDTSRCAEEMGSYGIDNCFRPNHS